MIKETQETCSLCSQIMVAKKVTLLRKKKGKIYSFTNVPVQVCPDCGEKWYATETLKMIDEMIRGTVCMPYSTIEAKEFNLSTAKN